ncbi:MAG: DUF4625 domain-containing protein [Mediterranea sp.]|jgi:hypothetical protein|nr:DUF4625 domain-containing protein [Mediterranea sp.]
MKTINCVPVLLIAGAAVTLSFFTSCTNDGDTTPPVIDLIEPAEGDALKIGSPVHFEMEVSDNEMLSSYKVEIHSNFDGHEHSRVTRTTAFFFERTWSLSGLKNTLVHQHDIVIPEDATEGDYHLMVRCTDAAGNEAHLTRNIVLSHDGEEHGHEE